MYEKVDLLLNCLYCESHVGGPRVDKGAKPGPVLGILASGRLYWPMRGPGCLIQP